jgi:hypothetical protein
MQLTSSRAPRVLLTALLAIAAAAIVAACGSSGSSSSSSSSSASSSSGTSAQFAKYQSCLKSHGVTFKTGNFKRPSGTGTTGHFTPPGGEAGTPPSGGFKRGTRPKGGFVGGFGGAASKKDQAAFKACASDAPKGRGGFGGGFRAGGGQAPGGASGGAQFSAATLKKFAACVKQHGYTLPAANTSGKGPIYPRKIEANRTFQTASKSCQSLLRTSGASASGSSS